MEDYIDPEFKNHQAIARSFAEMMRMISDVHLLPFDVREYAQRLNVVWQALADHPWYQMIENQNIPLRKYSDILGYGQKSIFKSSL